MCDVEAHVLPSMDIVSRNIPLGPIAEPRGAFEIHPVQQIATRRLKPDDDKGINEIMTWPQSRTAVE